MKRGKRGEGGERGEERGKAPPLRVRLAVKISTLMTLFLIISLLLASWFTSSFQREYTSLWLFIYFVFLIAVSIIFTMVLDKLITRPLNRLIDLTTLTEKRGYETPIELSTGGEMGLLSESMERLRLSFLEKKRNLEEINIDLDRLVEKRTEELKRTTKELQKTQRRLVQKEKLASIGELAGGVAHEINNPTGIILNRVEYMMEKRREGGGPAAEDLEDLEVIRGQVLRISRITSNLTTFSRTRRFEMEAIVPSEVVDECITTMHHEFSKKGCGITREFEKGGEGVIEGNRERLIQAFINIMKNSLEAMDVGGILMIGLKRDGGRVGLSFEDSGTGIPEENLSRVFDPFFTTKKTGEGTGLGLAITYGIIQEHRGNIEVKNREGGGTKVVISFPEKGDGRAKKGRKG